jgi:tryptophanase
MKTMRFAMSMHGATPGRLSGAHVPAVAHGRAFLRLFVRHLCSGSRGEPGGSVCEPAGGSSVYANALRKQSHRPSTQRPGKQWQYATSGRVGSRAVDHARAIALRVSVV